MATETKNIIQLKETLNGPSFYPETHIKAVVGKDTIAYLGSASSGSGDVELIQLTKYDGTSFYPVVDITSVTGLSSRLTTIEGNITTIQGNITTLQGGLTTLQGYFSNNKLKFANLPALYIGNAQVQSSSQTAQNIGGLGNVTPGTNNAKTLGSSTLFWASTYTTKLYLTDTIYFEYVANSGNGYVKLNAPLVTDGDQIIISGTPGGGGSGGTIPYLTELLDVIQDLEPSANKMLIWTNSGTNNAGTTGGWTLIDKSSVGVTTNATTQNAGLMSAADKTKLDSIKFGTQATDYIPITIGSTTKNVLTAHQSLAGYATETYVGQQITALNLGTAATYNVGSVASGNTGLVTGGAVWTAIDNLPEPMIFKGSLGTGGTITTLPAAASSNEGYTYKVITAGTYQSITARVGDTFISTGSEWVLIPSGDEPMGTVTSVGLILPTGLSFASDSSTSPITSSGTFKIAFTSGYSIPTTANQTAWSNKYDKPSAGIPLTDLASGIQTSLGLADTAYQKPSAGIPATDLASVVQTNITNGATAYGYFSDGVLPVSHGGTGRSTLTSGNALIGNGTGQVSLRSITNNTTATAVTASTNLITANTLYYHKGNSNLVTVGEVTTGTWNATAISVAKGGTSLTTFTGAYRILYSTSASQLSTLAPNTTTTKKFLRMTGTGSAGTAPAWDTLVADDIPNLDWSKITTGNGDLKAIENLTGTSGLLRKTAADTWELDTKSYYYSGNFIAGTDYVSISGTETITGAKTFSNNITFTNNYGINIIDKPSSGNGTSRSVLYLNASNHLVIGNGLKDVPSGGNTYLRGVELHLQTCALAGTYADRVIVNSSGNVTLGNADSAASSYKLYVTGATKVTGQFYLGTSSVSSFNFVRGSANYFTAPADGYFAFVPNGLTSGVSNSSLVITAGSIYPGAETDLGRQSSYWHYTYTNRVYLADGVYLEYNSTNQYVYISKPIVTEGDQIVISGTPGGGGGGGGSSYLYELLDVNLPTTIPDGDFLSWDRTSSKWINRSITTYDVFTASANGLAPMASSGNKTTAETAVGNYYLCADGKYRQLPANAFNDHTYTVNNGTFTLKTLVGSTTTSVSDFTANQSGTDDITFVQGTNITITPDATNRKITIAATDTTYGTGTAANVSGADTTAKVWTGAVLKSAIEAYGYVTTDNKVTQTATTTSAAYELLFSATADNTTRTEGARKTSTLTYNPSTKALSTGGTVNGLTLSAQTTGFKISGGTTSKTLTVGADYTLGAACTKAVVISIDTSASLPTSNAVKTFVEGKGYVTSSGVTSITLTSGTGITVSNSGTAITGIGSRTISLDVAGAKTALGLGSMAYETASDYQPAGSYVKFSTTPPANANIADNANPTIYLIHKDVSTTSNIGINYGVLADLTTSSGHLQFRASSTDNDVYLRSYWWTSRDGDITYPAFVKVWHSGNFNPGDYLTTSAAASTYLTGTSNKNVAVRAADSSNTWGAVGFAEGDNTKYNLYSVRFGATPGSSYGGSQLAYGSGIMFGGGDTRGFIALRYGAGHVEFGGGSVNAPTTTVGWHFGINGTDGVTYDLPTIASNAVNGNTAYNSLGNYVLKAGDTMTGALEIDNDAVQLVLKRTSSSAAWLRFSNSGGILGNIGFDTDGSLIIRNAAWTTNYTVWHSGNSNLVTAGWNCSTLTVPDLDNNKLNNGIISSTNAGTIGFIQGQPTILSDSGDIFIGSRAWNSYTWCRISYARQSNAACSLSLASVKASNGQVLTVNVTGNTYTSGWVRFANGQSLHSLDTSGYAAQLASFDGNNVNHLCYGGSNGVYQTRIYGNGTYLYNSNREQIISISNTGKTVFGSNIKSGVSDASGNYASLIETWVNSSSIDYAMSLCNARNNATAGYGVGIKFKFSYGSDGTNKYLGLAAVASSSYGNGRDFVFYNSSTEIARLNSAGSFIIAGNGGLDSTATRSINFFVRTGNTGAGNIFFQANYNGTAGYNGFKISSVQAAYASRQDLVFYRSNNITSPYTFTPEEILRLTYDGHVKVTGDIQSTGDQTVTSDACLKENFGKINYSVSDIAACRAITFDWKDGRGRSAGSIAQDWKPLIPELVHGEDGNMTLAYGQIALINSIIIAKHEKEQDAEIRKLKERILYLEEQLKIRS